MTLLWTPKCFYSAQCSYYTRSVHKWCKVRIIVERVVVQTAFDKISLFDEVLGLSDLKFTARGIPFLSVTMTLSLS